MTGRVCQHCKLDADVLGYEMRLYAVHTRAMAAGSVVTAEEALRQVCPGLLSTICPPGVHNNAPGFGEQDRFQAVLSRPDTCTCADSVPQLIPEAAGHVVAEILELASARRVVVEVGGIVQVLMEQQGDLHQGPGVLREEALPGVVAVVGHAVPAGTHGGMSQHAWSMAIVGPCMGRDAMTRI